MSDRISTRDWCNNNISAGTFSTETTRCTTYQEIVNSGTIAIIPSPRLTYSDTHRCTLQDDLTSAGRDVVVHIKNSSSNAATTDGKITFYITGIQAAVYGASISNLQSCPVAQTITINSANEFTVTIKADDSNKIAFGFTSPAVKYCQACYNYTITNAGGGLVAITPWSMGVVYEPMVWSNTNNSTQSTTFNRYIFDITDTDDVYIFLARNSQIKNTINVYLKSITYVKNTSGLLILGDPMSCKMKDINVGGVNKFTTETEFNLFYAQGAEYLLGQSAFDAGTIVSFVNTTAQIRLDSENPNGSVTQRWKDVTIYTSDPSGNFAQQSITTLRGTSNLDAEDVYLELYAKAPDSNIIRKYVHFDTSNTGQWIKESTQNPDKTTYTCYKSNSNKGTSSSVAISRIKFQGYSTITFYIRSYAETTYDYTAIGKLNTALSTTYSSTYYPTGTSTMHTNIYANTRGKQTSSYTSLTSHWTAVTYIGLTSSTEYYVDVAYCKDSTTNSYDDRGYILIPTPDNAYTPSETLRDIYIYFILTNGIFIDIRLDFQGGDVDICTLSNEIIRNQAVSMLQYSYSDFGNYYNPATGTIETGKRQTAFQVGLSQPSTAAKINMTYPILVSTRSESIGQNWHAGSTISPNRLSYATLTQATYGRDGGLINLGNQVWYAIMNIDASYHSGL